MNRIFFPSRVNAACSNLGDPCQYQTDCCYSWATCDVAFGRICRLPEYEDQAGFDPNILTNRDYNPREPDGSSKSWLFILTITLAVVHSGPGQLRIQTGVLDHSLVRALVRSHHSLIRASACSALLALIARSAALTHSLARSLHSIPHSWDSE